MVFERPEGLAADHTENLSKEIGVVVIWGFRVGDCTAHGTFNASEYLAAEGGVTK